MKIEDIKVGQRVRYAYRAAAISCCSNGIVNAGEGTIAAIRDYKYEPNVLIRVDGVSWLTCVFPREVLGTVADSVPA